MRRPQLGLAAGRPQSIVIQMRLIAGALALLALLQASRQKVGAVSVQRLQVPDLVVVEVAPAGRPPRFEPRNPLNGRAAAAESQPEAASLVGGSGAAAGSLLEHPVQITFECLINYDPKRDKNLIVKWHHDERNEPIYQWIPELNKRSIAPQYRAHIAPLTSTTGEWPAAAAAAGGANRTIEASFKLVRPSKELGGKYTCSAISAQNDDSKSKKMIVYTPPRSFTFNASRANLGALFAGQRDRLIQLTQPAGAGGAYRARQQSLEASQAGAAAPPLTTISPQMLSTIDYVNVNRARQAPLASTWPASSQQQQQQLQQLQSQQQQQPRRFGLKLVCDIDQVFPVPEVSIFRLAAGRHAADKLAKLDTRIERDPLTGLFRVQVTSVLDDDELQTIRQNQLMLAASQQAAAAAAPNGNASGALAGQEPGEIYFECLIALTNLELSRYADNRRALIYRPATHSASLQAQMSNMRAPAASAAPGALAISQLSALVAAFAAMRLALATWAT